MRLPDVSHAEIQAWVNKLSSDPGSRQRKTTAEDAKDKGLSPAGVIQAYQVLDQTLQYAVRSKYMRGEPSRAHTTPPQDNTREDRTHARTGTEACGGIRGAGDTGEHAGLQGLRYGECAALRVRDVDLQRRRLEVWLGQ